MKFCPWQKQRLRILDTINDEPQDKTVSLRSNGSPVSSCGVTAPQGDNENSKGKDKGKNMEAGQEGNFCSRVFGEEMPEPRSGRAFSALPKSVVLLMIQEKGTV